MATKLVDTQLVTTVGVYDIPFASAPVGGFNAQAKLGSATLLTARLLVRTHADADWLEAGIINLASGGKTSDNIPVYPSYEAARWDVTAISGGGAHNARLTAIGLGI